MMPNATTGEVLAPEQTTHLFLLDAHSATRRLLGSVARQRGLVVHEFDQGTAFLNFLLECDYSVKQAWQLANDEVFGCILSQTRLPDMHCVSLMKTLHQRKIRLPLLVTADEAGLRDAVECMRYGAANVVQQPYDPNAVIQLVCETAHVPVDMLRNPQMSKEKLKLLTPRERQVMAYVCEGKLNKTIADVLGISVKTVELHRARVISKLKVRNIQDLVRLNLGY